MGRLQTRCDHWIERLHKRGHDWIGQFQTRCGNWIGRLEKWRHDWDDGHAAGAYLRVPGVETARGALEHGRAALREPRHQTDEAGAELVQAVREFSTVGAGYPPETHHVR
jgi:hypothetical protein